MLVSLKKNSAVKYIEKVEKWKKYKEGVMSKQKGFGLNVTQMDVKEFKGERERERDREEGKGKMTK